MTVDRTRLKRRLYDRKRKRLGQPDTFDLIKFIPASGYSTVATIEEGWYGQRVTHHALGAEFFEVKIAENGTSLSPTFRGQISHLKMGDYFYKLEGVEEPKSSSGVWLIRCGPTGQRTAT